MNGDNCQVMHMHRDKIGFMDILYNKVSNLSIPFFENLLIKSNILRFNTAVAEREEDKYQKNKKNKKKTCKSVKVMIQCKSS